MDKVGRLVSMIFLLVLAGSCIRDKESACISEEYHVRIFIEDKNYENVEAVDPDEEMDEALPFGMFIETLHYTLQNLETGAMFREAELVSKTGMGDHYEIGFADVPYGRYRLTVWGNVMDNVPVGFLHKENQEDSDMYLASTIVTVDSPAESSDLMLKRAKGMLQLQLTNLPAYITSIGSNVTNVFESVGPEFEYAGNTSVMKTSPVQEEVEVTLAPSVADGTSKLQIQLFMNATVTRADPVVSLPEIDLDIHRNEITLVNVNYNTHTDVWEIWTYINGKWVMIHSLDVN